MKGDIDSILDECLRQLQSGQVTLDDCLAHYPDQAAILRPQLEIALEVPGLDRPKMSPLAVKAGKQRMFAALAGGNINIQNITTSEIKISCLIDQSEGKKAFRLVHDAFDLGGKKTGKKKKARTRKSPRKKPSKKG